MGLPKCSSAKHAFMNREEFIQLDKQKPPALGQCLIPLDSITSAPVRLGLPQGPSYLATADKEQRYAVFSFDLTAFLLHEEQDWRSLLHRHRDCFPPDQTDWILPAQRREDFSRLYPHILGMLGNPGDALVIAQKLPDRHVHLFYGYINWQAAPVLQWSNDIAVGSPTAWKPTQPIGLRPGNIKWMINRIDRRTRLVRARLLTESARRQLAAETRKEALKKSQRALYRYRYRDRKKECRARQKEAEKQKELAHKWAAEVIANLQASCERLRVRQELQRTVETLNVEQWL